MFKIALNCSLQGSDVQSGLWLTKRSNSVEGTTVIPFMTDGAIAKKEGYPSINHLPVYSSLLLSETLLTRMNMLLRRILRRCIKLRISAGSTVERTATTAALSRLLQTTWPDQCRPHTAAPIRMGISSLVAILVPTGQEVSLQANWNHYWFSQYAPHPHDPDASDVSLL